jgi:Resolvase, N terminal domain
LVETIEDRGYSAKDLRRPGMKEALRTLEAGDAKALVVAKLDRLSRSMIDFTGLMGGRSCRAGRSSRSIVPWTRRRRPGTRWRTCLRPSRNSSAG